MEKRRIAIIHYTAPPVVGGVEAVMRAQAEGLRSAGHSVRIVAGRGACDALPDGVDFVSVSEMDSRYPQVLAASKELERGRIPRSFEPLVDEILSELEKVLKDIEVIIVHNIFTKHFNLPLTVALSRYLELHDSLRCLAWCHDFTWTSEHSRPLVHEGYPWELLRTRLPRAAYVTVSMRRRKELAQLLGCSEEEIAVLYNGVDAATLFGLSGIGLRLVERLGLLDCGISLLMPVRVTQAKNIELAIRLAAELKRRIEQPRLVLTGPPDPHDSQSLHYYQSLLDLRSRLGVEQEMRFVYESGPDPVLPLEIGMEEVAQLYRACDVLFMPSRREGFGMPILEAGLIGMPVVCTDVPAAGEIAGENVMSFRPDSEPAELADRILAFVRSDPVARLRLQVRTTLTWRAIYRRGLEPLIER